MRSYIMTVGLLTFLWSVASGASAYRVELEFRKTEKEVKDQKEAFENAVFSALWPQRSPIEQVSVKEKGVAGIFSQHEFEITFTGAIKQMFNTEEKVRNALTDPASPSVSDLSETHLYVFDGSQDTLPDVKSTTAAGAAGDYTYSVTLFFERSKKDAVDLGINAEDICPGIKAIFEDSSTQTNQVSVVPAPDKDWKDVPPTLVEFEVTVDPQYQERYPDGNAVLQEILRRDATDKFRGGLQPLNLEAGECLEPESGDAFDPCSSVAGSPQPPLPPTMKPPLPPPFGGGESAIGGEEPTTTLGSGSVIPGRPTTHAPDVSSGGPPTKRPPPDDDSLSGPFSPTKRPPPDNSLSGPSPRSTFIQIAVVIKGSPPVAESPLVVRLGDLIRKALNLPPADVNLDLHSIDAQPPELTSTFTVMFELRNTDFGPKEVEDQILAGDVAGFVREEATSFRVILDIPDDQIPWRSFPRPNDSSDSLSSQTESAGEKPRSPRFFRTLLTLRSSMTVSQAKEKEPELRRDIAKACDVHEDNVTITNITEAPSSSRRQADREERRQTTSTVIEFEITASSEQFQNETVIQSAITNATDTGGALDGYQINGNTIVIVKTVTIETTSTNSSPVVVYEEDTTALLLVAIVGVLLIVVIVVVTVLMVKVLTKEKKKSRRTQPVTAKQLEESGNDHDQFYGCSPAATTTTSATGTALTTSGTASSNMQSFDQQVQQQQFMMQQMMQNQQQLMALQQQQQQSNMSSFSSNNNQTTPTTSTQEDSQPPVSSSNPMHQQPSSTIASLDMQ